MNYITPASYFCAALLVVAAFPLPYGYYLLLRIFVTAVAIYCAYDSWEKQTKSYYLIGFLLVTALFNPFIMVHFDKLIWIGLDIILAFAFFWYGKNYRQQYS